jgi:hypothetical protein
LYTATSPSVPGTLGGGRCSTRERESGGGRPLDDDAELIARARGGDISAFELVERYQQVAVRLAHVMCGRGWVVMPVRGVDYREFER